MTRRWTCMLGLAVLLAGGMPSAALARMIDVAAGDGLAAAVAAAAPFDTLNLLPGNHPGGVVVDKPLTIEGPDDRGATVTGSGEGSVIRITSPDVTIRNLHVTGSGTNSTEIDAGIYVAQGADRPVIENNFIAGNLFGVSLHGPNDSMVRNNVIRNRNDLWLNNRGNGIHMWNTSRSSIDSNDLSGGRDGIFVQLGAGNILHGNHFAHLRFAVHFMYSKGGSVTDNVSIGNHVAYALMYSDRLTVTGNISVRDRDYGLMLNSARRGDIGNNIVSGAEGPCLFFYLALQNHLHDNHFDGCGVGVRVTGSDANIISGNAFTGNHVQMHYAGTKTYEWSDHGRGNYWSDNPAFDLDGDGIADTAYRPNDIVDWIVWRYPLAKLLMSSPSMEILRASQGQFPALYPGGVVDSFPLMQSPALPRALPAVPADLKWEEGFADEAS